MPDTLYEWRAVATDASGSTTSSTWTVRTPPSSQLVDDTFARFVTNGWGAADASHAWQTVGTATSFSVDGAAGRMSVPVSGTRRASLAGVSTADVRIVADLAMTQAATGSGTYIALLGRAASSNSYRVKLKYPATGGLTIALARVAGSEAAIGSSALAGITPTPGQLVRVKFEVEGTSPTTLRAKAWRVGTTEPANWTVTATDSTAALQTAGTAGVEIYTSSSATAASPVTFDRFTVSRPGTTPPANQAPTAAIGTPTINGFAVGFNGSGSTDSDGTIAGYA